jgi:hypothetical protein
MGREMMLEQCSKRGCVRGCLYLFLRWMIHRRLFVEGQNALSISGSTHWEWSNRQREGLLWYCLLEGIVSCIPTELIVQHERKGVLESSASLSLDTVPEAHISCLIVAHGIVSRK